MTATALHISNLQKTYANGLVALKGIDLSVREGEFFALLGRNGAGKSTAIGIISSLIRKSGGSVKIFDADIDEDFSRAKSYIGVVPQEFNFSIFETPMQIVCNQAGYYGIPRKPALERAREYLGQLGLWGKRDQMTQTLSGGMKRRLMIARALMHRPRLLILDEPSAGVDIEIRRSMWKFLRGINDAGTTIILTTHYLDEAESLCRHIAIIDNGRLVESTGTHALLGKLQKAAYVLELAAPLASMPPGLPPTWVLKSPNVLEVDVESSSSINALFEQLAAHNIAVRGMRTKTNRLERLFLDLTKEGKA